MMTPTEIVRGLDLPHKRVSGWVWNEKLSESRLELYADRLLKLGMSDGDVIGLLSDLYWDSYLECVGNRTFEKLDLSGKK